jgi:hypothetical protein
MAEKFHVSPFSSSPRAYTDFVKDIAAVMDTVAVEATQAEVATLMASLAEVINKAVTAKAKEAIVCLTLVPV